jgi:hypothetical protein
MNDGAGLSGAAILVPPGSDFSMSSELDEQIVLLAEHARGALAHCSWMALQCKHDVIALYGRESLCALPESVFARRGRALIIRTQELEFDSCPSAGAKKRGRA